MRHQLAVVEDGMKRGTPEHFKTMRLATLLSAERPCDRAEALGIVEALCNHFAPRSAPQGNVGRCTNAEIAAGCYSSRDPDTLVRALVEAKWLDESDEYRLCIHDWKDHADEAVRKWLKRNHFPWLSASGPCRVVKRMPSRRHLDGIRPPRAGNGKGSLVLLQKSEGGVGGRRKPEVPWPDDLVLTEERAAFAERGGLLAKSEWGKFHARALRDDARYRDWGRAWEVWCRNAAEWAAERQGRR